MGYSKSRFFDIYTNILDTVSAAERGRNGQNGDDEIELNLMKYFLLGEHPVLTLPQAGDTDVLIRLATKPDGYGFLSLLKEGFLSVSLYGAFESLSSFVSNRLENAGFTFSNRALRFLRNCDADTRKATRVALANAINKKSYRRIDGLPIEISGHRNNIDFFYEGIMKLDEALSGQYRPNLHSSATFATELFNLIRGLPNDYEYRTSFEHLYEEDKNNRSDYRDDEGKWCAHQLNYYSEETVDSFLALVDLAYNQEMCKKIATHHEWVVSQRFETLNIVLNEDSDNRQYKQRYDVCIDESRQANSGSYVIDWDNVLDCMRHLKKMSDKGKSLASMRTFVEDNHFMSYDNITESEAVFNCLTGKTSDGVKLLMSATTEKNAKDLVQYSK